MISTHSRTVSKKVATLAELLSGLVPPTVCSYDDKRGQANMGKVVRSFWASENGEDLLEYTILIALMVLGVMSLLGNQEGGTLAMTGQNTTQTAPVAAS